MAQHLPHFRVVTAVVNEVDVFFFQAGDQRGEIFLPGGNTVEEDDVGVSRFQPVLHRTRQPFAILLFVVNDGDALGLHRLKNVFCRRWPLGRVQPGSTHDVLITALGQLRIGRSRRDHQNTFVFIDI